MVSSACTSVELGEGVYTVPEAARILGRGPEPVSNRQVRYWIKTGLAPASFVSDYGKALSFHDLISLEVIRRFRGERVSLQRIRWLEQRLREQHENRLRPLAYETFFTDGVNIWAQEFGEASAAIEMVGRYPNQRVWTAPIRTFAEEIRFGSAGGPAVAWTPSKWVELNPRVQFGAPVVAGTRIPVASIAANLRAGTPVQVADWYGLTEDQVLGVREYLEAA